MLEIPKTILQQHSASPGRVFCVVRPTGARKLFVWAATVGGEHSGGAGPEKNIAEFSVKI